MLKLEDATWCYKLHGLHYKLDSPESAELIDGDNIPYAGYEDLNEVVASEIGNDLLRVGGDLESGVVPIHAKPVARIWRREQAWMYLAAKPYREFGPWELQGDYQIHLAIQPACKAERIQDSA